ncbi:hypothetical protein [Devosia epidermidihirudinis]|nr:hypothetical protein [Devosia epidermidihirudinis]
MRSMLALTALAFLSTVSMAQETGPAGTWRDSFGTTMKFSMCGDGTQLCATLLEVQGKSRTPSNLAFVNKQIMQAKAAGANKWKGTVTFDGAKADSTITQVSADQVNIQGCRLMILCQTLSFNRVKN